MTMGGLRPLDLRQLFVPGFPNVCNTYIDENQYEHKHEYNYTYTYGTLFWVERGG